MSVSPEDLFSRNIMFYGRPGFERLQRAHVAVVGLGGVGSYACEALARAGAGRLRIIDCDVIKPSDVNRQLIALADNAGKTKVEAAAERLKAINPHLQLDPRNSFFHQDTAHGLLTPDIDYVIDAIDSLNPKGELIRHCLAQNIPFISVMGAAGKNDPSHVRVSGLDGTSNCRLARALRRHLRAKGIPTDIMVVYSDEQPRPGPQSDNGDDARLPETSGTYLRGRARSPLPSLPTIPAIFGLTAAHHVILELLKKEG